VNLRLWDRGRRGRARSGFLLLPAALAAGSLAALAVVSISRGRGLVRPRQAKRFSEPHEPAPSPALGSTATSAPRSATSQRRGQLFNATKGALWNRGARPGASTTCRRDERRSEGRCRDEGRAEAGTVARRSPGAAKEQIRRLRGRAGGGLVRLSRRGASTTSTQRSLGSGGSTAGPRPSRAGKQASASTRTSRKRPRRRLRLTGCPRGGSLRLRIAARRRGGLSRP